MSSHPSNNPASETHASSATSGLARFLPWLVAGAFFMELLDGTVISTALPQMGASFGVGAANMSSGMTAYLLTLAIFIPVSGWIADRFGARPVFVSAIAIFTLASLLCAASPTLPDFIAARVTQGIGGAMMVPVGRMVVLRTTARKDLVRALNTITWPGLMAPVLGPPIGGFLTTYVSWRWIFWLNLPLGIVAAILALRIVPPVRGAPRPFDRIGFALSGGALAGLMYAFDRLSEPKEDLALSLAILACAGTLGWLALRHARAHPSPMLDLTPAAVPSMAANVSGGSLFRIAFNTFPYLMPLLLQVGLGMSAFRAGVLILTSAAGDVAIKSALPWVYRRFGFRRVLMAAAPLCALSFAAMAAIGPTFPDWTIALILVFFGVVRSAQYGAINTLGFSEVPPAKAGAASTLVSVMVQLNTGIGIAFGAIAVHAFAILNGRDPAMPGIADFKLGLVCSAVVSGAVYFIYRRLPPSIGATVSGHSAT